MITVIELPEQRIRDTVENALYGAINYWCDKADWDSEKLTLKVREATYASGLDRPKWHTCDFAKGLKLMAEKSPRHFGDLLAQNDDAETADVLVQYAALGEVVYG